ncbi:winged helix-turn-helix domain-containing protein, partial [Allosphingosinicella sp.]|uniref:winged helix-turn-helix domain-containing protein n=1 Tax=Allosphingosinicella sp. TaxID=2823234 RepID=UPI002FC1E3F3
AAADRGEIGWGSLRAYAGERRSETQALLARIRAEGPLAASDFEGGKGNGGWWGWGDTKRALEWLFWAGHITTATRRASFERVYDVSERVIPAAILALPTPAEADAKRALVALAARASGIATEADLRDYFRLDPASARAAVQELIEEDALVPVMVEGWTRPAYVHRDARWPRRIKGQALLAPFDPLVWHRGRTERLFGFRYRIEIYTPAEKRTHGYYVLPFLLGDRLVARVDLKADRRHSRLLVQAVTFEPDAPPQTGVRLQGELQLMTKWLDLETVEHRQSA